MHLLMDQEQKLKIEEDIIKMLKTVYDPELPVDVYSLGLIYKIDLNDEGAMTDEDKNSVLEDALKAVETYFKGNKWEVKIENGKLYARNKAGDWEDLGNLKYKSEFETIFRGSYYGDVVELVYENRNKK